MSPLPLLQLRCPWKVNSDPVQHHSTHPSPAPFSAPFPAPSAVPSSSQVKLTSLCVAAIAVVIIVMVLLRNLTGTYYYMIYCTNSAPFLPGSVSSVVDTKGAMWFHPHTPTGFAWWYGQYLQSNQVNLCSVCVALCFHGMCVHEAM